MVLPSSFGLLQSSIRKEMPHWSFTKSSNNGMQMNVERGENLWLQTKEEAALVKCQRCLSEGSTGIILTFRAKIRASIIISPSSRILLHLPTDMLCRRSQIKLLNVFMNHYTNTISKMLHYSVQTQAPGSCSHVLSELNSCLLFFVFSKLYFQVDHLTWWIPDL